MISYDGNSFPEYVRILDIRRSILPTQELRTLSMEGRDGSLFYGKTSGSLEIEIDLIITGGSPEETRKNVRDFAFLIDAEEPKPMILPDEPDKFIDTIISGDSGLDTLYNAGQATIVMFAPDPYFYAINDDVEEVTETGNHTFEVKGNMNSYPLIRIEGTNSNGKITITTDNNSMSFTGNLSTGETLIIDSDLMTSKVVDSNGDTIGSAIPHLSNLDFPVLLPGLNRVNVTTEGNATLNKYTIESNSRWK